MRIVRDSLFSGFAQAHQLRLDEPIAQLLLGFNINAGHMVSIFHLLSQHFRSHPVRERQHCDREASLYTF